MNKQPPSSANQPAPVGPGSVGSRAASGSSGSYRAAAPAGAVQEAPGPGGAVAQRPLVLRTARLSSVGKVRDHQEDALEVIEPASNSAQAQRGQLLIVADGMGGHNAGEVASQMAVAIIRDTYYTDTQPDLAASLRTAMTRANEAIFNHARQTAGQTGMGTTAVVMAVRQNEVQIGSIGDSRVYVWRNGKLAQVTSDHSWVEEQVRAGVLTAEQARAHPQRNVITRALGTTQKAQPEFFNGALNEGDVFLLCSDGLTTHVSDAQIQETLQAMTSLDQAANRLVTLAMDGGGSDNISVILARAEAAAAPRAAAAVAGPAAAAPKARSWLLLIAAPLGLFVIVAAAAFTYIRIVQPPNPKTTATVVVVLPASATPPVLATATGAPTELPTATQISPTATAAANGSATSTLAPTPTSTTPPPTRAPTRSSGEGGAGTPKPMPAPPVLIAPQEAADVTGETHFAWDYAGQLGPGQAFEVRIWKDGESDHLGAAAPTTAQDLRINVDEAAGVQGKNRAAGDYWWTVAVVQTIPSYQPIGKEAPPRRFKYTPPGPPCNGDCER